MTRPLPRAAFAAALLLSFAAGPRPALAQDDAPPAEEPTAAPAVTTVQWIEGWGRGAAKAKETGALMLVYVHRVNPP